MDILASNIANGVCLQLSAKEITEKIVVKSNKMIMEDDYKLLDVLHHFTSGIKAIAAEMSYYGIDEMRQALFLRERRRRFTSVPVCQRQVLQHLLEYCNHTSFSRPLLVCGASGSGKTALMHQFLSYYLDSSVPFGAIAVRAWFGRRPALG